MSDIIQEKFTLNADFNRACLDIVNDWEGGKLAYEDALRRLQEKAHEAHQAQHPIHEGRALQLTGYIQHSRGDFFNSQTAYDTARRLYARANYLRGLAVVSLNQGENYRNRGEFRRARQMYTSAYHAATTIGDVHIQAMAVNNEALILIQLRDLVSAKRALSRALEMTERSLRSETVIGALRVEIYMGMTIIALLEREVILGWEYAQKSLENAKLADELYSLGLGYRTFGDGLSALEVAALGDEVMAGIGELPMKAEAAYEEALRCFREIKAEAELARTLFHYARHCASQGEKARSVGLLRDAMVIFTRLGMRHDAVKSAELQVDWS